MLQVTGSPRMIFVFRSSMPSPVLHGRERELLQVRLVLLPQAGLRSRLQVVCSSVLFTTTITGASAP